MAKLSPHNHLSGSVLPAYMGLSPYQTAFDVLQTARDYTNGIEPPPLDSLPADIGSAVEPVLIDRGLRALGIDPKQAFHYTNGNGALAAKEHESLQLFYSDDGLLDIHTDKTIRLQTNETAGIFVLTPDGTANISGMVVLEAKFTTVPEKPNDPPLFRGPVQLQAGMMCHKAAWGLLFTCYAGRKLTVHVFPQHDETRRLISSAVIDFETRMKDGSWPEPTNAQDYALKFNEANEVTLEMPLSAANDIDTWMAADEQNNECDAAKINAGQRLMAVLGNHTKGRLGNYEVKWPFRKTKAKPAVCCPKCSTELEPAKPASEARQKSISIKELK
jgi:hypothetical protein